MTQAIIFGFRRTPIITYIDNILLMSLSLRGPLPPIGLMNRVFVFEEDSPTCFVLLFTRVASGESNLTIYFCFFLATRKKTPVS